MVPAVSDKISRVSPYSGSFLESCPFRLQGFHLLSHTFPGISSMDKFFYSFSRSPSTPVLRLVWALSLSLATTKEIDFSFFSSSYLDVSVHWVTLLCSYLFRYMILAHYHQWVPPFGHLRIIAYLQLPEAFRCLSRPSSSSNA